jgi:hypothetical protein
MTEQRHYVGVDAGQLALMRNLAEAAAEKTGKNLLKAVGLDPDNPMQSQDTMAALRRIAGTFDNPESKADAAWTRRTRVRMEGAIGKVLLTSIGIAVASAAHALWAGVQAALPLK